MKAKILLDNIDRIPSSSDGGVSVVAVGGVVVIVGAVPTINDEDTLIF